MTVQRSIHIGRRCSVLLSAVFGICIGFAMGLFVFSMNSQSSLKSQNPIGEGDMKVGKHDVLYKPEKKENGTNLDRAIGQLRKKTRRLAVSLYNDLRLLCWVMHEPKGEDKRQAVLETWGRRCQVTLFMVGRKNMLALEKKSIKPSDHRRQIAPNAYIVYLEMDRDHYDDLWLKTRLAFIYINQHFRHQYDWVLKVDDDSFVMVENLRLFLYDKNQTDPIYYGCQYKVNAPRGYSSGGPGYVISATNVEKLAVLLEDGEGPCDKSTGAEDVRLAQCINTIGIGPGDTRDQSGRFRFSPFTPENTINHETLPPQYSWFWEFSAHQLSKGFECCSDTAISFHYITPSMIRTMEYLIYYIPPFSDRELWHYISDGGRPISAENSTVP